MDHISFEDVCRHVGRLYLSTQQQLDRQDAAHAVRVKQLEGELAAERKLRVDAERAAAKGGS